YVKVTSDIAKKSKKRLVPIQDNLRAWLALAPSRAGNVMPREKEHAMWNAGCEAAGKILGRESFEWVDNGVRHSFASYRLAAIQDAPKVACELGHPNPTLLYSTYAEVVTPEDAKAYWSIMPKEPQPQKE